MSNKQHFKYSNSVIVYPILIILTIWIVFWFQVRVDSGIKSFGIRPQNIEGLVGVFTSPFLHADIEHLYHNTIPLFVLLVALFYFYKRIAWKVLFYGILLSGMLTWLIGNKGNHIGASGLVYVLVSFIFFKGIFAKHYRLVALSLMVIFLYGSMIWYVFPVKEVMSWEGHLGGLITGFVFALIFRRQVAKPERYVWETPNYNEEEDPFMKHFDEDGNFIELVDGAEDENSEIQHDEKESLNIKYIFKKKED